MHSRTYVVSALMLSSAMVLSAAAIAGNLPKEGSNSGAYSAYGTYKVVAVGQERMFILWDENGLTLSDGFNDHTTSHCWGTGDYIKGVGQDHGYCVDTDPEGDQIVEVIECEKHTIEQKMYHCTGHLSGGTGKFTGITGGGVNLCHPGEFKASEGTYLQYCAWSKAPYKIVAD